MRCRTLDPGKASSSTLPTRLDLGIGQSSGDGTHDPSQLVEVRGASSYIVCFCRSAFRATAQVHFDLVNHLFLSQPGFIVEIKVEP